MSALKITREVKFNGYPLSFALMKFVDFSFSSLWDVELLIVKIERMIYFAFLPFKISS